MYLFPCLGIAAAVMLGLIIFVMYKRKYKKKGKCIGTLVCTYCIAIIPGATSLHYLQFDKTRKREI